MPLSNEASLAVTLCPWLPRLLQVIVPPTGTVAAKLHELISVGLPSTIACGTGAPCAVAIAGSALNATASTLARAIPKIALA